MRRKAFGCIAIGMGLVAMQQQAQAENPEGLLSPPALTLDAAASAPAAPDKSQYTLFNPTPREAMRDMDTDRPNKTNTPHTIDAGHLQLEAGLGDFVYARDKASGNDTLTDTWETGQFNLRVGIVNNLELNAAITSFIAQRFHDYATGQTTHQNGFGDTVVGGKFNVWGNDGADGPWATALAIQPQVTLPTARHGLSTGHVQLSVGVPLLVNLPNDFHLGLQTTPGCVRNSSDTGYVADWQNSISVDRVVFDKLDLYVELWSDVTSESATKGQATLDTGVTYPLTANISLDTGVNFGLNNASPTFEWLFGVSVRY
jgi:hypothetical protein